MMRTHTRSDAEALIGALRALSRPLAPFDRLDDLVSAIGDSRIVLLGEASHGTSEYYTWRARLSKRLIEEKGLNFVAVEGDWPDCYEVNRFVKGWSAETSARQVLHRFDRWPTWMWANWEIVAFTSWLRASNQGRSDSEKVGFYGLDVYSLWESLEALMAHLGDSHPALVEHAERAFDCFEPFEREPQHYAWHTALSAAHCENELIDLLRGLRSDRKEVADDPEAHFNAEQNALVALGAERYYRTMVRADGQSWNLRDTHMTDTLDRLLTHYGPESKAIVWEHNTHVGDARYTDMADEGMVNIGQLARERHPEVFIVGFGSYSGSVIAGRRWGAAMERMEVPPARKESWEDLFHLAEPGDQLLIADRARNFDGFREIRGHRAIGVVYNPEHERLGNYVPTDLVGRYDAFLFVDASRALHPLHLAPHHTPEPPDTYPWGV